MKKMLSFLLMFIYSPIAIGQININPDPYGEPWIVGGIPAISQEKKAEIEAIPKFAFNPLLFSTTLPQSVDNSERPFMRGIFHQNGNSCSQATAIGYMFTYEINYARNLPATNDSDLYHPSFTYNFLNYGSPDSGSYIDDGLEIISEIGCMNIQTYGKSIDQADSNEWITGYEKYLDALQNRITTYETINLLGDSGLFFLKHWLNDHNSFDTVGGLAGFGIMNFKDISYGIINSGPESGKSIMISFLSNDTNAHALTIVGYNDSIRFDYDFNNIIEEWEFGAFKAANSHGLSYPPVTGGGYIYIPYHIITDSAFLNNEYAYICNALDYYVPEIIVRAKMTHPNRKFFMAQFGFDAIAGFSMPSYKPEIWPFTYHKSGESTLTGFSYPDDTLELALDFSYNLNKYPEMNLGEIYFRPRTNDNYQDSSYLWFASINDYRWNEQFELPLNNTPGTMEYGEEWKFSVDYDLLPFSIESDTLLETDQIYRLSDTISEGATLTIGSGHTYTELHFHDAQLLIEEGSTLHLASWASIIAKSGTNKIIVKGELIIEPNAVVKSEGNATLEIYFKNDTLNSNFSDCSFEEIEITGFSRSITIDDSHLTECHLYYSSGDLIFEDNSCSNTNLTIYHPANSSSFCSITNNQIENDANTPGWAVITVEDYPSFSIQNDSIQYHFDRGIELFYAGREARGVHSIENNVIQFTGIRLGSVAELGIHAYYSNVNINNNKILFNDYGITGFHRSEMTVLGNDEANGIDDTQIIGDNEKSQCLFNISTFPTEFHWNVIRDTSLEDKPYIKVVEFDEMIEDTSELKDWTGDPVFDVTYNCWLNETNPENRLVPIGAYDWDPTWCPGSGHLLIQNEPELMYYQAISDIESESFTQAETGFKQIIAEYPENKYAQASLKALFALNPAIHGSDFTSVKAYCDSLSLNPDDSLLGTTANWISIHCDIKNQQFQQAINSLDSIISNPGTLADSVFAMIDLNYVYLKTLDSSNLKSTCISVNENILAKSYQSYTVQRKDWIELLMNDRISRPASEGNFAKNNLNHKPVQFTSIHPNPASEVVNINYQVEGEGTVNLSLYSITGQKFFDLSIGTPSPGDYSKSLSLPTLSEGMYFLVISLDGVTGDIEKIVKQH